MRQSHTRKGKLWEEIGDFDFINRGDRLSKTGDFKDSFVLDRPMEDSLSFLRHTNRNVRVWRRVNPAQRLAL